MFETKSLPGKQRRTSHLRERKKNKEGVLVLDVTLRMFTIIAIGPRPGGSVSKHRRAHQQKCSTHRPATSTCGEESATRSMSPWLPDSLLFSLYSILIPCLSSVFSARGQTTCRLMCKSRPPGLTTLDTVR